MIARLIGGLMLGVGILLALSSGLCTIVALGFVFNDPSGQDLSVLPMVLLIGAPFFVVGAGLFLWGRQILRNQRERDKTPPQL